MPDVAPSDVTMSVPIFIDVDPTRLLVDESYQRNLSERSVRLIRRIVGGWDWRAFKPPVVVDVDGKLHVVDGQHTAIAAASHPGITTIPVMMVEGERHEDRAAAFVKHNRDRISATPTQLHHALVAAGDEDALTIDQACRRAGARILRQPPGEGRFKVGETLAVSCIRTLCSRRGAMGGRQVLQTCVEGMMAPVSAAALKAVEELLFGESYRGQVQAADIATTIREMGTRAEREGARFAAEHDLPAWKGLVVILFRNTKKVRSHGRRAAA
ncbi:DUF6551 family protein [Methylobacterium planeticum]|uniref:ParB/Sulfiredoxin domain-containing protein n=1 Tax=Methylobacterium planeticum TaxID=2615211 RepID=A0A6N6MHA9_9HYPH|nr:DUF6551 family protein [Methylobacterium planeticum]KAB1068869.1 hypothetical protein F6X51_26050 [Methylobacterium planeticum]